MKDARRFALAAVLPLALALPGCGGGDLNSGDNREHAELERARVIWHDSGVRSYQFTALSSAEPSPTMRFQSRVLEQKVLSSEVREVPTERLVEAPYLVERYGTIERLFDTIERVFDEEDTRVEVDYDAARGYPTSIRITNTNSDFEDGNGSFFITAFEVLD